MIGPLLALLLVAALAAPAQDGAEPTARETAALRASFVESLKRDGDFAGQAEAARAFARAGTREAAQLLLEALPALRKKEDDVQKRRGALQQEMEGITRAEVTEKSRNYRSEDLERLKALDAESKEAGRRVDGLRSVRGAIAAALASLEKPEAAKYLAETGLKLGKPEQREAAARALGQLAPDDPAPSPALLRVLATEREPEVKIAIIGALRERGATDGVAAVAKALEDPAWPVRAEAIRALESFADKAAIGPLIRAMEKETGRLRDDVGKALERMTGERIGSNVEGWKAYWKEKGNEIDLGGAMSARVRRQLDYYGLTTSSERVVFVIDTSGSMETSVDNPDVKDPGGRSKLRAAQNELANAVKALRPTDQFGIVVYNDIVVRWEPGLLEASDVNKQAARDFIESLVAVNSTNIFDALETAFDIAGFGARDKNYASGCDTIFFLSDGSPTSGRVVEPDGILAKVREWNSLKKVVVHSIGLGREHNRAFMERLARENGGEYVAPAAGGRK